MILIAKQKKAKFRYTLLKCYKGYVIRAGGDTAAAVRSDRSRTNNPEELVIF